VREQQVQTIRVVTFIVIGRHRRPSPQVLSSLQEQRLITAASTEPWLSVVGLMLRAGLRQSEALRLRNGHIDFDSSEVVIPPRGRRMKLPDAVLASLSELTSGREAGLPVFPDLYEGNAWRRGWRDLTRSAGLGDLRLHQLRATYVARYAAPHERI
jgi:integrase